MGRDEADLAWLVYDLVHDSQTNRYFLQSSDIVYTQFQAALKAFTIPPLGDEQTFLTQLQRKLVSSETAPDIAEIPVSSDDPSPDREDPGAEG